MYSFAMQGDSTNSTSTLQHLKANKPAIILNMGDLVSFVCLH